VPSYIRLTREAWKVVLPIEKGLGGKEVRPEFTQLVPVCEERDKLSKAWSDLFFHKLFC
jgi:hypothetical protein